MALRCRHGPILTPPHLSQPEGKAVALTPRRHIGRGRGEIAGGYSGSRVFGAFPVDKFILVPLPDDDSLRRAFAYERYLLGHEDLLAPLGPLPREAEADAGIAKAHAAIARLRALGGGAAARGRPRTCLLADRLDAFR